MTKNQIIHGDCLKVLPELPKARMIFADPPDNLGLEYDGYKDKRTDVGYLNWLHDVIADGLSHAEITWLSCYYLYQSSIWLWFYDWSTRVSNEHPLRARLLLWRFTFGQHRDTDCGNGYRPLFRFHWGDVTWDTDAIRIESQRQRNGDERANPDGRVPDDVWDFSRVCGTFKERRKWHPAQHPEALVERMVLMSTKPGDLVIDLFAGSGTTNRVCKRIDRNCIGIDISKTYCQKIAEETGAELIEHPSAPKTLFQE